MGIFDENKLKPEELQSGFEAGAADDDSFMVGPDDDYYGEMPPDIQASGGNVEAALNTYMGESNVETQVFSADSAEDITTADKSFDDQSDNVGSAWDSFDDGKDNSYAISEEMGTLQKEESLPLENENFDQSGNEIKESEPIPDETELGFTQNETPLDTLAIDNTIFDDIPTRIQDKPVVLATEEMQMEDLVDDELKKLLQMELAESKQRREKLQASKPNVDFKPKTDEEIKKELESFESIDDIDGASEFDLSLISAEHPSQYSAQSDNKEKIPVKDIAPGKEPVKEVIAVPTIDHKERKVPKETTVSEEKKRKLPLLIFGLIAASLLLLGLIGFGLYSYLYTPESKKNIAKTDTLKKDSRHVAKNIPLKKKLDHKEAKHDTIAKAQTTAPKPAPPIEEKITANTETKKIEKKTEPEFIEKQKPTTPRTVDITPKPVPKPKENIQKPVVIVPQPKIVEKTKPVENFAENKDTKAPESSFKQSEGMYIVQVYASPSESDANMWLERLKNKNVDNPFISTQKIRDKIWYRVRFGSFTTKDEAFEAAMKLGFSQSWVDRVR